MTTHKTDKRVCTCDESPLNDKDALDIRVGEIWEQIEKEGAKKAADLMILEEIVFDQSYAMKAEHLKFIRIYFGLSYEELAYKLEKMGDEHRSFPNSPTTAPEIEAIEATGGVLWQDESFFLRAYAMGRLDERKDRKAKEKKESERLDRINKNFLEIRKAARRKKDDHGA